jgi:membrane peptidoglycan carboxypeptidase
MRRLVLIGALSGVMLFVAGVAVLYAATRIPLPGEVKTDQTSVITYADGTNEIARIGTVNRTDVQLSAVSKDAQHAVLAAEDRNFYNEPGISTRGIARALWVNVSGGGTIKQGGSTITQQYAKNAYLTQKRTFSRKMQEIVLAVKLDQKYSKDQILEYYLNTIYFGRGAYGIEAASKTYFNKPAKDLTAGEGAVIAGLIRSPGYLDPAVNPKPAESRWHDVIDTMVAQGWLATGAETKPPQVLPKSDNSFNVKSDQAKYIRDQVIRELGAKGITEDQINTDGLRITTTIDYGRQTAAFQAVSKVMAGPQALTPDIRTGLVAVQPGTGKVLAWYGGSLYGKDPTTGQERYTDNVSQAWIPSGSTFKAVTLLTALSNDVSLKSIFAAPKEVTLDGNYHVENDETGVDFGYQDLTFATAESLNTVYVPLGQDIGVNKVISMARSLGVKSELRNEAGVTLGPDAVYPTEMVSVYSTLASGGVRTTPHIVDKVTNGDGKPLFEAQVEAKTVLDNHVVRDATYALQQVIDGDRATGKAAKLDGGRPAAGKTGTVTDFRAAWFCGYTPQIASCVDMFRGDAKKHDDGTYETLKGVPGTGADGVYGGNWPAKIWKAFMDGALQGQPIEKFDPPSFAGHIRNDTPTPSPTPSLPAVPDATTPVVPTRTWSWTDPFGNNGGNNNGGGNGNGGDGGGGNRPSPAPSPSPTSLFGFG